MRTHTPNFGGYRPRFYFRTTDVTGTMALSSGSEMCLQGGNVELEVLLPDDQPIALEDGQRFAIREAGRTVGSGAVTGILM